jgi:hypothetical protein
MIAKILLPKRYSCRNVARRQDTTARRISEASSEAVSGPLRDHTIVTMAAKTITFDVTFDAHMGGVMPSLP